MSPKKIIFCLPGKYYSGEFLTCWTELINHCFSQGHTMYFSQKYTSNVYFVRSMCLGADIRKGENQKPFDGKIDYDYIMWIDSDIIFTVKDFNKLLLNNVDICGGIYLTEDDIHFAAVKNWDESKLQHQGTFDFLTRNDINKNPNPIEVAYTGFGFLLIKYGVFEKIKYPWFSPKFYKIGDCHDFSSEDVSFCTKAKENGFKIYIDPTVWVKHQKLKLL